MKKESSTDKIVGGPPEVQVGLHSYFKKDFEVRKIIGDSGLKVEKEKSPELNQFSLVKSIDSVCYGM